MHLYRDGGRVRSAARLPTLALAALLLALAVGCAETEPQVARAEAAEAESSRTAPPPPEERPAERAGTVGEPATVARVIDGDTIELEGGTVVRLVQIDAPEVRGAECYAGEATAALEALIPPGTRVSVATDPALDHVDRYGRQLAYVFKGDLNLNLTLVQDGAASVWFYRGARGRYADELLAAAVDARDAGRGLWGACEAALDPMSAVSSDPGEGTGSGAAAPAGADGADGDCHPAYEPCLPVVADLNCPAVRAMGKAPVRVKVPGRDPYRLDGDRDGVGCE